MDEQNEKRLRSLVERKDVEGLMAALADKNMDVRTRAAQALGDIGDNRAVKPLIMALNDTTDYPVFKVPLKVPCTPIDARGEAALALGKIGGKAALEALQAVTDTSGEKGYYRGLSVREAVEKALAELKASDAEDAKVSSGPEKNPEAGREEEPKESAESIVRTADGLRIRGQLNEALEHAMRATDAYPLNGFAWMERGLIAVAQRDVVTATRAFQTAVTVSAALKGSEPGARLAVVYARLGMNKELQEINSSLDYAGLGLDPSAEREWRQLVAVVDPGKLQAAIESGRTGIATPQQPVPEEKRPAVTSQPQTAAIRAEPQPASLPLQEQKQDASEPQAQPISKPQPVQAPRPERPGCITAYAILLIIGAGLMLLAGVVVMGSGGTGIMGAIILVELVLAVLFVFVALGLWRMKNWARITVIVLQGLGILGSVGSLLGASGGGSDGGTAVVGALAGIVVGGYVLYWFASNRELFV